MVLNEQGRPGTRAREAANCTRVVKALHVHDVCAERRSGVKQSSRRLLRVVHEVIIDGIAANRLVRM